MSLNTVNIPEQSAMVSEELFLKTELDAGISPDNKEFMNLAFSLVNDLKSLTVKSVLDYGAGTGAYAEAFHVSGYEVTIWEKFKAHKEYLSNRLPHIKISDKPITTDLMLFIEVAEHMTDKELDKLFKAIQPQYILFSSTSERTAWDLAWGHINVKEQTEWVELFENKGYSLVRDTNVPTSWAKLFEKK